MDGERERDPTGEPDRASGGDAAAAPAPTSFQRRERAALDALRTALRDVEQSHFGVRSDAGPDELLALRLRVSPAEGWALAFDPPLAEQLLEQASEWRTERGVYHEGAVYCYKCGSAACAHAVPPEPMAVFAGYDPMGLAEWRGLAQVFIEERDERVDRLYEERPPLLARVQAGRPLRTRQLGSFGRSSRSYAILGQVVAGPLAVGPSARGAREQPARMALTFQFVETCEERGAWRLRLNTLATVPGGGDLGEVLVAEGGTRVKRARDAAREAAQRMEARVIEARAQGDREAVRRVLAGVPGVLHRLAQSLERGDRQDRRRTPHARRRREEQRPVAKALEDARAARPDAWYVDEKTAGLVVCGPRGRAHVFAADGRHVTSFLLRPGASAFRVRTHRWRPAETGEVSAIADRLHEGETR